MVRVVKAYLHKYFWEYRYYFANYLFGTLGNLVLFLGLFYAVFGRGGGPKRFYQAVMGFILWMLGGEVLDEAGYLVWEDSVLGTLEHVYMSPRPFWQVMMGRTLAMSLVNLGFLSLFAFGAVAVHRLLGNPLSLPEARWGWVELGLAGALAAFWGLGAAFFGLALLLKRVGSVIGVVHWLLLFFSGALFSLEGKPLWFKLAAYSTPIGPAGQMVREAFLGGNPEKFLTLLLANSACYALFGALALNWCLREARKRGKMARY